VGVPGFDEKEPPEHCRTALNTLLTPKTTCALLHLANKRLSWTHWIRNWDTDRPLRRGTVSQCAPILWLPGNFASGKR